VNAAPACARRCLVGQSGPGGCTKTVPGLGSKSERNQSMWRVVKRGARRWAAINSRSVDGCGSAEKPLILEKESPDRTAASNIVTARHRQADSLGDGAQTG